MAWALQAKMTIDQMLSMPYYHPTVSEALRTALQDLKARRQERQPSIVEPSAESRHFP